MFDDTRQDNIDDPSTIFQKFRDKASKSPIRTDDERQRENIKSHVPKITDDDIMELCQKYPKKHNDDDNKKDITKGGPMQMHKLQMEMKRKQTKIVRAVDKSLEEYSKHKFRFSFQQLMHNFKDQEMKRNQLLLETEDVNTADPESLKQLYLYVLNSELNWLLEANQAAAEYHAGKFDPAAHKWDDPKKLKKKQKPKKKVPL